MPSIDYFECEDCGFRWKDQGPLMFCLNDDGEIEEYILVQEAYDLDKDSQISGDIVETYCSCCEKKIKLYLISIVKKHFDESGAMLAGGWKKLNGKWYHLGAGGIADTGWFKDNGKWYYLDKQGTMQTGLQKIGNKTYIMDASGAMLSNGWQKANNQWYYLIHYIQNSYINLLY